MFAKAFRFFCFVDLSGLRRRALAAQEQLFPELDSHCASHSFGFRAVVDLWIITRLNRGYPGIGHAVLSTQAIKFLGSPQVGGAECTLSKNAVVSSLAGKKSSI